MSDMGMFLATLASIIALGGVLYTLMRTELRAGIGGLRAEMNGRFDVVEARLNGVENDLRPIKDALIGRALSDG